MLWAIVTRRRANGSPRALELAARGLGGGLGRIRALGLVAAAALGLAAPAQAAPPAADAQEARAITIERIDIVGVEQVSLRQIRRVLQAEGLQQGAEILWPEDPRVDAVRDRLRATGYFKSVTLRVDPVEGTRDRVVLVVDVEERGSVAVTGLYLGSSRMTPFRGGMEVVEHNLLGRGIHLGGAFIWGTRPRIEKGRRQQAYKVHALIPRFGDVKLGATGGAWIVSAAEPYRVAGRPDDPDPALFRSFDYDRIGGQVGLTFPLLPQLDLSAGYRFERVDAARPSDPTYVHPDGTSSAIDLDIRDGVHRHTTARFGVIWDGRREAFLAGRGGRFAFDLQASSPAVGSEYEYVRLVAGGAYSFRLPWRHWLTPSAMGGQIAGDAPVFERFYAGDLSEWTPGREQGLRYSTRNPIDVFGTGVDTIEFGNIFGRVDLEYAWPLFRRTRTRVVYGGDFVFSLGIFVLAGNEDERRARRAAGDFVAPVGFNANLGLRLDTAIGTFDLSVGNVLRRTPL